MRWPDAVKALQRIEFERIVRELDERPREHYATTSVRYLEDLRIATLRRISLGVCHAEPAGIPRSWVLRMGPKTGASITGYIMREAGGFRPFLDLHVNPNALEAFGAEGWDRSWRLAAAMHELDKTLRGVQCSAWFNDPVLARISPRLSYLRARFVDNGGVCFRVGGTQDERMLALVRSPTRRTMFAQGQYAPAVYACVWARRPLLRWASRGPAGPGA